LAANQLSRRFYGDYESVSVHPQLNNETALVRTSPYWSPNGINVRLLNSASRKERVGLVEMGGASAQVVLEPPADIKATLRKSLNLHRLNTNEQKESQKMNATKSSRWFSELLKRHPSNSDYLVLNYCLSDYPLAVQCLEGMGRQAAMQQFLKYVVKMQVASNGGTCADEVKHSHKCLSSKTDCKAAYPETVLAPCLPVDVEMLVDMSDDQMIISEAQQITYSGLNVVRVKGIESHEYPAQYCREILRNFLADAASSSSLPFELSEDYKIYATENFYYFNEYVLRNNQPIITPHDFWDNAKVICHGSTTQDMKTLLHPDASDEKVQSACFGSVFLSEFLRTVLKIPSRQNMKAVTSIKELETSFAIGSIILELPKLLSVSKSNSNHHDEF